MSAKENATAHSKGTFPDAFALGYGEKVLDFSLGTMLYNVNGVAVRSSGS
jgi:hypothetical protein